MANLKLVSSEYNSVALYYILTSIDDVATNADIDGNLPLVAGSLAYDRNQNIYCFDGALWSKKDGSYVLPADAFTTISDNGEDATITTLQYYTYDFGGQMIDSYVQDDPTGYLKAYVIYDHKLYELQKKDFVWGETVNYFGADPSGTYPALSFDFSEYPFAIAKLGGNIALVVPNDPIEGYEQTHKLYAFAFTADS